jgi:hypothetical protein
MTNSRIVQRTLLTETDTALRTPFDVLADKDPHFTPANFCSVIRRSAWRA